MRGQVGSMGRPRSATQGFVYGLWPSSTGRQQCPAAVLRLPGSQLAVTRLTP